MASTEIALGHDSLEASDQASKLLLKLSASDLDYMGRVVREIKAHLQEVIYPLIEKVHLSLDPVVAAAHLAHKEAVKARTELLRPLQDTVDRCQLALSNQEKALQDRNQILQVEKLGDLESNEIPLPTPTVSSLRTLGVSIKVEYGFTIRNPLEVKPEYLVPDLNKIKKVVDKREIQAMIIVGGIDVFALHPRVTVRKK